MNDPTSIQLIAAISFVLAVIHTFSTKYFEYLALIQPRHAGVWHLLGEVEVVFGFWAMALVLAMLLVKGKGAVTDYLDSRNFTEPMFVFAIMVIAGSRPILEVAERGVRLLAVALPTPRPVALYFVVLAI